MDPMFGRPSGIKKSAAKTAMTVATGFGERKQVLGVDARDYVRIRIFSTASGFLAMTVR
jgi:hypothetical protein